MVYQELRRLASYYLQSERGDHTLQPTALVHELYLKLFAGEPLQLQDREHFLAVAARQLRHIVVDYARSKHAQKRGGPQGAISLDEASWFACGGGRANIAALRPAWLQACWPLLSAIWFPQRCSIAWATIRW